MTGVTVREFGFLEAGGAGVPAPVFDWLENQALRAGEAETPPWLRLTKRNGRKAVQVVNYVGVVRSPQGFQIEVLPKVDTATEREARDLLIDMLRSLGAFRHLEAGSAKLLAARMPLLEVFIGEFLQSVGHVVKRGLRSDYRAHQDNIAALRGKLLISSHIRHNLCRRDRFFAEFDEFSPNRPENRLLHAALRRALSWTTSRSHQQLARELCFIFSDIPPSVQPGADFQRVRLDRGMNHYADALAWAKLILAERSPLTGAGDHQALSLLFPMEAVFEAFVAKHLAHQIAGPFRLEAQSRRLSLIRHQGYDWFRLKPDLLIGESATARLVLDTKWKLLDRAQANGTDKYRLAQSDFYQMHAYGQSYLDGQGDVVLIYPRTDKFPDPLPVFEFPKMPDLRLWVLPFSLTKPYRLALPDCGGLDAIFIREDAEPGFHEIR